MSSIYAWQCWVTHHSLHVSIRAWVVCGLLQCLLSIGSCPLSLVYTVEYTWNIAVIEIGICIIICHIFNIDGHSQNGVREYCVKNWFIVSNYGSLCCPHPPPALFKQILHWRSKNFLSVFTFLFHNTCMIFLCYCAIDIAGMRLALHTFFGHWSNLVSVKIIANCTLYVWHQSQWKVSKPPGWSFSDLFNATHALFHLLTNLPQNSSRTNMFYGWPSITCLHWHSFVDCNQHWECGHHGECKKSRKYYDDGFYKRDSDVEKRSKLVPK